MSWDDEDSAQQALQDNLEGQHLTEETEEEEAEEQQEEDQEEDRYQGEAFEDEDKERIVGTYNADDVVTSSFDQMELTEEVANEVIETWNIFVNAAESREMAGDAIFSALFESAPSLQSLFKSPRAVMVMRFVNGLNQIIGYLNDPRGLKMMTETLGFQHLDFEVTVPRVIVFRDTIVELLSLELGGKFTRRAKDGWATMLNYIGGSFIYVRVTYADRLKILASSWAVASNNNDTGDEDMAGASEDQEGEGSGDAKGTKSADALGSNDKDRDREGSGSHSAEHSKNTSVPTTFNDMFIFNSAVMGFEGNSWMSEVLNSFDAIVRNVSNTYRLQEECDVLGLRIAKCKDKQINMDEFKSVMLATLRSLVPKAWDSAHEVAWSWLWENVERMIKSLMGKPVVRERALKKMLINLDEDQQSFVKRQVYVKFFALSPLGQDFFKQSTTRLHFISGKVVMMTLDMYEDPKGMIDNLSAIGLRHVGYGTPTDLFGPYVSACVQVIRSVTQDDMAEEAFRWSLSLMSRVLVRVVNEGSTIVMKAINMNSARQLKKAIGCAPRGKRALWMLNVQVGTQSISPFLWAIETGSLDAAHAITVDLLTIRADRDRYYYGMDTLFDRHQDIIRRLCVDAPTLLPTLLDGLVWRSRTTENGFRRVNYYIKHLVVDAQGGFSQAVEWVTDTRDPKIVCHPVLSLVTDTTWGQVAMRTFLFGKVWFLVTLAVFITSQSILNHVKDGDGHANEGHEAPFVVRALIALCRLFIYVLSMGHWIFIHIRKSMSDLQVKRFRKFKGIAVPAYIFEWQDAASFTLTCCLLIMLVLEPILHCMHNADAPTLAENCPDARKVVVPYSVFSTLAMLIYFSLLIDLSVLSTRISAFALVCFRVLSEVGLFLAGLLFICCAFASAISSMEHHDPDFEGIDKSAMSLFKITFGMLDGEHFDLLQEDPAVFAAVLIYIVVAVIFLLNLLIAQLNSAYASTYGDMLGYARLNRGRILTETMPAVSKRRWNSFVESLNLESCVEFGEGDIGIPGGIQVIEAASANITTVDMIKRFGGSTSPMSQWPEEETTGTGEDDAERFERMEKMVERTMKKLSSKRKGHSGSALHSGSGHSGSAASNEEASDSHASAAEQ